MRISRRSVKISPWSICLPVKMPRPKPWDAAFLRCDGARYISHSSLLDEKNEAEARVAPRRKIIIVVVVAAVIIITDIIISSAHHL
mmetsp:Transcript_20847/g.34392  ORF Transcript_20847/g.34392 Transcript_20847/m.34392 type:complete len:86 (-) Transcript_20847:116-373(-)